MVLGNKNFNSLFDPNPVFLAPMFEITNLPFRLFCKMQGASAVITEFISVNQLLHVFSNNLLKENPVKFMIGTSYKEKPVGLQLFGYDVKQFKLLSKVFDPLKAGFDFLDLNIGCPVPKICATGSGSRLLADDKILTLEKILKGITKSFPDIPLSIKMRSGYKSEFNINKVSEILNSLDLLMVTIHPKLAVVPKGDSNLANHSFTKTLVENISHPVIANGGINSLENAKMLQIKTNSSGTMIGRHAMKFPFVFNNKFQSSVPVDEFISGIYEILNLTMKHGYSKLYMVRDQILNLVRAFQGSKLKRTELQIKLESLDPLFAFVENLQHYLIESNITEIPRIISK